MHNRAYTLLSVLCNLSINFIIISMLLHYSVNIYAAFTRIQHKIDYQQAILIATHYLGFDARNARFPFANVCTANTIQCNQINHPDLKDRSDILLLNNVPQNITFLAQDASNQDHEIIVAPNIKTHTGDILQIFDGINHENLNVLGQHDNRIYVNFHSDFAGQKVYPKQSLVFRPSTIAYYLRKSIINLKNHNYSYTLYRDDLQRTSQALIEGIADWQVKISPPDVWPLRIQILLTFKNSKLLELKFVPHNQYKV